MASPVHTDNVSDEDYNLPSTDRVNLLHRIQDTFQRELHFPGVSPHFWACCQLCDIGSLEEIANLSKPFLLNLNDKDYHRMIAYCKSFVLPPPALVSNIL
jgi:hypothetical protein